MLRVVWRFGFTLSDWTLSDVTETDWRRSPSTTRRPRTSTSLSQAMLLPSGRWPGFQLIAPPTWVH